jgi:branched-chain amino acid transport system permease protein
MHVMRLKRWIPFVLLATALTVFPLVASTSAVNIGVYALIYGIAAIGLSLLMGLAGQVSLGHAAFFAVGAYTQAILVTKAGWSMWPAAVVSVVAAMFVALLVGLPLLRLRGHFLALATLGLGIIVAVVVRELEVTGGTSGLYGIPKPEFGGRLYDSAQEYFWLLSPFVLLALLLAHNLVRSRTGRALGAVNDSEVAAECLGVDTFALRLRVFVLAAGYAGLAGVFYAHWLAVVSPEASGFELSVEMLLMVVLGGLGTVWGALTGAVTVQLLDEGSRDLIRAIIPGAGGEVQLIAFGVVLVLVIILVPGGLAQLWRLLVDRLAPAAGSTGRNDTPEASETVPIDGSVRPVGPDGVATLLAEADLPQRGTPLLVVRGLTKRYGGVTALSHLDLEVRAGEILALIGPNGAGKTTAFNMISSVLPPTEGTVTFRGTEVQGRRPHEVAELGATRTFQNLQVFGSTTVLGNVKVARHLRSRAGLVRGMLGLAVAEERGIESASRAALAALGLEEHAGRPVTDLPFGLQRQVEIARALALAPSLVLLDEPMAGLSGVERTALSELLRQARDAGVSVLLVEHDVDAVMALADRVAVLDDGHLIAFGGPDEVRANPAVVAAYLGVAAEDERLVREAAAEVES